MKDKLSFEIEFNTPRELYEEVKFKAIIESAKLIIKHFPEMNIEELKRSIQGL